MKSLFLIGSPVKISDLAKNDWDYRKTVDKDIKIEYIGLREGEKLYEEYTDNESLKKSYNPLVLIVGKDKVKDLTYKLIEELIQDAQSNSDNLSLVNGMKKIVKEYNPLNSIY